MPVVVKNRSRGKLWMATKGITAVDTTTQPCISAPTSQGPQISAALVPSRFDNRIIQSCQALKRITLCTIGSGSLTKLEATFLTHTQVSSLKASWLPKGAVTAQIWKRTKKRVPLVRFSSLFK